MKNIDFDALFKTAKNFVVKHSPEILTGVGITGMITTTVLAVKATPKALMLIEERKLDEKKEQLKPTEVVATTWKCYIPATVTGATSIACFVGATSINAHRNAALIAAATLSETRLNKYKEKVIEALGEEKETEIHDKVMQDEINEHPVTATDIFQQGKGETLFYDGWSGVYFRSDIENVRRARNELNNLIIQNTYASLNDFYSELRVENLSADTKLGDYLGWNIRVTGTTDIRFSTLMAPNEEPCIAIDFTKQPVSDYTELY